ncbi:MAG TPA: endonuclease/exonuclease/phosphatase, partial [Thermoguttaceae bacterium]
MIRLIFGILLIALLGFGGYVVVNYKFETHYENGKFSHIKISPRGSRLETGPEFSAFEPSARALRPTFRIATFSLGGLDENKLGTLRISDVLVHLLPRFELIALEGVRGKNQGVLVRLVEQINAASGRQYDFATCPTQKRDGIEHYSAFVFDRTALEIDRSMLHFVEDPLGRFRHKPLVGAFRVRGLDPAQAFTFTLVAVETNPDQPAVELDLLADVYRTLRDDGRNEDDIIMLGDFQADESHLGRLGNFLGITAAIMNAPTTVRGTQLVDNILFERRATGEFTGRAEVVDMMREFELTIEQAQEISEHLPVWTEFGAYEGGQKG